MSSVLDLLNPFQTARFAPGALGDPPPGDVTDGEDASWWDTGTGLLVDALGFLGLKRLFSSQALAPAQSRNVVEHLIITGRAALKKTGDTLVEGGSTLAGWYRSMKAGAMPRLYAGIMAVLGSTEPVPADRANARKQAAAQIGLLDRFKQQLGDGTQKLDGSVGSRAALYATAAWRVAQNTLRANQVRNAFAFERRVLGAVERHCSQCPPLAAMGWQPVGTLPEIGSTICNNGCDCSFEYRDDPSSPAVSSPTVADVERATGLTFARPDPNDYQLVVADLSKLAANLANDPEFHVGPGGTGPAAKPGAYANVLAFLDKARRDGIPIDPPRVGLAADGSASVSDGRHRLAAFRDLGYTQIPVAVDPDQASAFRKRFGAR